QQQAAKAVNVSLTLRNWLIGFYIVEFEQKGEDRAKYGDKLLPKLAQRCVSIKGLDERTFRNFRLFYLYYPQIRPLLADPIDGLPIRWLLTSELENTDNQSILGSLTSEFQLADFQLKGELIVQNLSYTHIEQLIRIEDNLKRTYYELECIKGTWSVRELKRQINSLYYERSGMSAKPELLSEITQQKAEKSLSTEIAKSVYAFEFLGLRTKDVVEETDLESALLDHLQDFMMEMGHGFCLEARQKKILIGEEYFFIDLVFYHRILKCHVLVELKAADFNHHNIGQLNTYVNYYKSQVMQDSDNPTVGILLVTDKNNALVEYATAGMDNQLFVSKYLLELPKKETLEAFIKTEMKKWNQ
ncbi:MAG: PDDEXK nuclease domain-containing protein, partial [Leadbetterella sp.]|nr:PDDEXK nuclease domain-containing protein [Leadbetterella sp.]